MRIQLRQWMGFAWCLLLLLFVTACAPGGQASGSAGGDFGAPTPGAATPGSTSSTTNPPGSGSPSAAQPTPGSASLNGCPSQQPPPNAAAHPADVVVSAGGGADGLVVSLRMGQTLEVRLSATVRWGLQMQGAATILTASTPNGWYDAILKACVWRFTATGAGSATLIYGGGLVCAPHSQCPTIAAVQDYTVTVQ